MTSDVGAIAKVISKVLDLFKFRMDTKEIRDLKEAAQYAQKLHKRAWKLSSEVRNDKTCNKYRKKFDENII